MEHVAQMGTRDNTKEKVESTQGNRTPEPLTEPYVNLSAHTALPDKIYGRNPRCQCTNIEG